MDKVYSIEQAEEWFLENHTGSVMCIRAVGADVVHEIPKPWRLCNSYPQAKTFYSQWKK
jgi:hypothetical protein